MSRPVSMANEPYEQVQYLPAPPEVIYVPWLMGDEDVEDMPTWVDEARKVVTVAESRRAQEPWEWWFRR